MKYRGHLLLPGEPGPGLKVNIDVAEHHLAVESDGVGLGAWPLEVVDVERLQGDLFNLTVAGEALRFVADDTLGFAYSGVPAIERVGRRIRGRSGLRSMLGWFKGAEKPAAPAATPTPPVDRVPTAPAAPVPEPEVIRGPEPTEVRAAPHAQPDLPIDPPVVEPPLPQPPAPVFEAADELAPDEAQCLGVRSDGRRCESQILTESGYCYPHDPRRAFEDGYEAAQEARAQLKKDATGRLNRIYGRLDKAMRQVERGELDPDTAMAMAQIARTMCAILQMDETPPEDQEQTRP